MKKINWKVLIFAIAVPVIVGAAASLASMGSQEFYKELSRPMFAPPSWVFGVAWSILYVLIGIASYFVLISPSGPHKRDALRLFYFQLAVNFFWPIIFFNLQNITAAFWWLLILLAISVATLIYFFKEDTRAGWLFVPYIAWLIFAAILNLSLVLMN